MQSNTIKIWGVLRQKEKIAKEAILSFDGQPALLDCLPAFCKQFDIAVPVVLQKHEREFAQFSRTVFFARDFMEPFSYRSFEIEILREKKENRA